MSKHILLLNCGSSSMKYQLFDPEAGGPLAVGLVERIGQDQGKLKHEVGDEEFVVEQGFKDHTAAFAAVVAAFEKHGPSLENVQAVGHRTVHGGSTFRESTIINDEVIAKLVELSDLAPLHNPPGIAGIEAAMSLLPNVPHVGIFDTAFFSSLPEESYTYAIPKELTSKLGLRRYGFHGTSHGYVSKEAAKVLGQPIEELKLIVCHLGNGASISAIDGGVAVDTSMGLTPLEGLVMGTRSGDIDPGVFKFLSQHGYSVDDVDALLNKQSGMLGLCGFTDMRDVEAKAEAGDADAVRAMGVYTHRLISYIGAYMAVLGGVDAVIFTAGIGENSSYVRGAALDRLKGLGFHLDKEANKIRSKEPRVISTPDSPVKILVVPTNEELAMAQDTLRVIGA